MTSQDAGGNSLFPMYQELDSLFLFNFFCGSFLPRDINYDLVFLTEKVTEAECLCNSLESHSPVSIHDVLHHFKQIRRLSLLPWAPGPSLST